MKAVATFIAVLFLCKLVTSQVVAFGADKMNVLYVGVDNPLTIVAENTDCSKIRVTTNNGTIEGKGCYFIAKPTNYGAASITATYTFKGKTKYSVYNYRVKKLPPPIFKIGSGQPRMLLVVLQNQQYVRAGDETFYYDEKTTIDSFTVCAFSKDSCILKDVKNVSNKINDEVKGLFNKLKPDDTVVFKNIYAKRNDEESVELQPLIITVY